MSKFQRRAKSSETVLAIKGEDSRNPYGIPIYDYLNTIQKRSGESGVEEQPQARPPLKKRKKDLHQRDLLCEKYRPTNFFDLLGNDDSNRYVLRWLNYWKSVVFGTEPVLNEYTDRLGRPLKKILLLTGPPGTGKTTAAHVIAQQSGFDVLEINASDERGAAVVQDRIVSAIQSHQVHRRKPVCIIADEIEGASEHGFIKALLNIINEDAIALSKRTPGKNADSKKKKKIHSLLLRPIIAICNNAWASSLHNLRPHAEIINFHRPAPSRLVKQLESICEQEKIPLTSRELGRIVENNGFDLRSCLNALQFGLLERAPSKIMENVEMTKWDSLLKIQYKGKHPVAFKQLETCSDIDRLVLGCFTAYPETGFNDDMMKKPSMLGDYLALADSRHSNDDMKALAVHACGQLFRSPALAAQKESNSSIHNFSGSWTFGKPPSTYETVKIARGIVQSVLKRSTNQIKTGISEKMALLELLPIIVLSVDPKLSTVPNSEEKSRISLIADILNDSGVGFRSEKLENGSYAHRLDPPIHQACIIGESRQEETIYGSYIARGRIKDALYELKAKSDKRPAPKTSTTNVVEKPVSAKPVVDFSSFFQTRPEESSTQIERNISEKANRVWVQYSEGFSNAVRKNICWSDLFK